MCAIGGVVNILMMMTANLVGFVIGVDGVRFFLSELMGTVQGEKGRSVASADVNFSVIRGSILGLCRRLLVHRRSSDV